MEDKGRRGREGAAAVPPGGQPEDGRRGQRGLSGPGRQQRAVAPPAQPRGTPAPLATAPAPRHLPSGGGAPSQPSPRSRLLFFGRVRGSPRWDTTGAGPPSPPPLLAPCGVTAPTCPRKRCLGEGRWGRRESRAVSPGLDRNGPGSVRTTAGSRVCVQCCAQGSLQQCL